MNYQKLTDSSFVWGEITLAFRTFKIFSSVCRRIQEDRYRLYPTATLDAGSNTLTIKRGTISLFAKTVTGNEIAIFYDSHYDDTHCLMIAPEEIAKINGISLEDIKKAINKTSKLFRINAVALWEKKQHDPFEKPPNPDAGFFPKILASIINIKPPPQKT